MTTIDFVSQTIEECDDQRPLIVTLISRSPWWIVATALHVLLIALAGLISMTFETPMNRDDVLVYTCCDNEAHTLNDNAQIIEKINVSNPCYPIDEIDPRTLEEENTVALINEAAQKDDSSSIATLDPSEMNSVAISEQNVAPVHSWDVVANPPPFVNGLEQIDLIGFGANSNTGGGARGASGEYFGSGGGKFGNGQGGSFAFRTATCYPEWCKYAEWALQWLASHQEPDGHWDARTYGAAYKTDTAVTGLSLLAFLGAGQTSKVGEYKGTVSRAIRWLKSKQQVSGLIFDQTDAGGHRGIGYPAAIATLALTEAAGMCGDPGMRQSAQKAIDYCVAQHNNGSEALGWRYSPGQAGDTSVTGWYVMALKSAKIVGLRIDPKALISAALFLDPVKSTVSDDAMVEQYRYLPGASPSGYSSRLSAIGNLSRIFLGTPRESLRPSVEYFLNKSGAPEWGANGESVDLYYWYYASLCASQVGGSASMQWMKTMAQTLMNHVDQDEDNAGSWKPTGEFSSEWGRVGQTALACLCLESHYRYQLVEPQK